MGLTPQQSLYLENHTYYEVYNINQDRIYGFCSKRIKIKFEEKHPNKLIFKKLDLNSDNLLHMGKLEIVIELEEVKKLIIENLNLQEKYPDRKRGLKLGLESLKELESEMMNALNLKMNG